MNQNCMCVEIKNIIDSGNILIIRSRTFCCPFVIYEYKDEKSTRVILCLLFQLYVSVTLVLWYEVKNKIE